MTPKKQGYKMPPEWYRHQGTILTYPQNKETFFDQLENAKNTFVEFVKIIALEEEVYINVNDQLTRYELEQKLEKKCVQGQIKINVLPTNDAWCRDYAPTFLKKQNSIGATVWEFNGWGEKYPHEKDKIAGYKLAKYFADKIFRPSVILEGGAIEINSKGTLLTTKSCVLKRNKTKPQKEIEETIKEYTGATQILWLPGGEIVGDDTDGHIDNIARFLDDNTIAVLYTKNKEDENYKTLKQNLEFLEQLGKFNIVKIPQPSPIYYNYPWGKMRLPASYLNFYISNFAVIVPVFETKEDSTALSILKEHFPDRLVIGIDARSILVGQGAFHCLSQQIPYFTKTK
ncbi:MAG: agmatine deiminase family protein [Aquificae bacterium]|nr:agmatine deiminase family protein [Aquificota bacterium]